MKTVILHIGLHKTGTTAFQKYMRDNRALFERHGILPYKPVRKTVNHSELGFVCLRPGVHRFSEDQALRKDVEEAIKAFVSGDRYGKYLFSGEAISYFRTDAECRDLISMFPGDDYFFHVILTLRDKSEWFRSYRNQILKSHFGATSDPRSANYVDDEDGWITDFQTLVEVCGRNFDRLTLLDYDRHDSISPIMRTIGIHAFPDPQAVRLNESVPAMRLVARRFRRYAVSLLESFGIKDELKRLWRRKRVG